MQVRELKDHSHAELLEIIALRGAAITLLERDLHEMTAKYEAVGAGGVSLMATGFDQCRHCGFECRPSGKGDSWKPLQKAVDPENALTPSNHSEKLQIGNLILGHSEGLRIYSHPCSMVRSATVVEHRFIMSGPDGTERYDVKVSITRAADEYWKIGAF